MIYIRRNTVLKTLLSLVVVLVVVKIQPSTFYPHPRLFTLTLDFGPSTLDPRQKPKLVFQLLYKGAIEFNNIFYWLGLSLIDDGISTFTNQMFFKCKLNVFY